METLFKHLNHCIFCYDRTLWHFLYSTIIAEYSCNVPSGELEVRQLPLLFVEKIGKSVHVDQITRPRNNANVRSTLQTKFRNRADSEIGAHSGELWKITVLFDRKFGELTGTGIILKQNY